MPTHARVRAFLESAAKRRILFTYQEVAKALDILPPHSIYQVTEALERLMEEDAAADRPFIAALVISKMLGGLPAPGFFDCAGRLGRFADGQDARTFHAAELNSATLVTIDNSFSFTPEDRPDAVAAAIRAFSQPS